MDGCSQEQSKEGCANLASQKFSMTTATISSKGQITVPVSMRNDLQAAVGDRVEFVPIAPGRYEFIAVTREVTALKGMFGKAGRAVSIKAMKTARHVRMARPDCGSRWRGYCTNRMRPRLLAALGRLAASTVLRCSSRALPKPVISARSISRGGIWASRSSTSPCDTGSSRPQSCPAWMSW